MAIDVIGGVALGDASKQDGGVIKASFNVSKTNVKFPITDFLPGRYILTSIGAGTPSVSAYKGTALQGLPSATMDANAGVLIFDIDESKDGLIVQGFEGAVALKTWSETATTATIVKPAEDWTYVSRHQATAPNDAEPNSIYQANGILMVSLWDPSTPNIWISEDEGDSWRAIRMPQDHNYPRKGAFLFDTNTNTWWISPRGTNYWYTTSHANLIAGEGDTVPWTRVYKNNESGITTGRVSPGNGTSYYRSGASYDQIYRITNDIWFSNLIGQDILRTGDGGLTWQEFRITAQTISPNTTQPNAWFDYGEFNGSEFIMAARDNNNAQVVRITNFLSTLGPVIQCMDIADRTFYGSASNSVFTVLSHQSGFMYIQNATTNITNVHGGSFSDGRRWHVAWSGNRWVFMDRVNRNNIYVINGNNPSNITAYNAETNPTGLISYSNRAHSNTNQSIADGNANNETVTINNGLPQNYRVAALDSITLSGGGEKLIATGHNHEWYDNLWDQVYPIATSIDDGENWSTQLQPFGRYMDGSYAHVIGGSNGSGLVRIYRGISDVNNEAEGVFSLDGGKTWYHPQQFMTTMSYEDYPEWNLIWSKDDNTRANHRTLEGAIATDDGKIVIQWHTSGGLHILQSFDNGVTWKLWRRNRAASENGGKGLNGVDVGDPRFFQYVYTDDGRFYTYSTNGLYSWSQLDFSDMINHNSLNDRLGESFSGGQAGLAYDGNKVILMPERGEKFGVIYHKDNDMIPKVFDHPGFEINFTGMAYGNGVWVAMSSTQSSSADYFSGATYMYSTDGQSWTLGSSPWRSHQTDRDEWNTSIVFTGSYFVYRGFGWKQGFRSADGVNWEPFPVPYNEFQSEADYNGDGRWDVSNHWAQNDHAHLWMYNNEIHYFNIRGQHFKSSASASLAS